MHEKKWIQISYDLQLYTLGSLVLHPYMIQWRWCHDESSEYQITKPMVRQFSVTTALHEFSDG